MATPRRVKRPRADSDATAATGAAAPDTTNAAGAADADGLSAQQLAELSAIVQGLPLAKVQALLLQAARDVPHVADAIRHEEAERKQREAQGVKRFNKYRNSAWRELRTAKDGVDAACEIEQTVEDILAQVLPHSSFGTKKNAAAAICDIYTWALQIDGMVGRRLRQNSYDWDEYVIKAHKMLTPDELERLATENDEAWVARVSELIDLASGYCLLPKLPEVLDMLVGPEPDDEEGAKGEAAGSEEVEGGSEHVE